MKILHMKNIILVLLVSLVFTSCGYTPSSKFSRVVLGEKISTSVIISKEDPENTVIIKDAVDTAIIETLQASLTSRNDSDSHLIFSISPPSYAAIQYDSNGYVIAYRMKIILNITHHKNNKEKRYKANGTHDFSITPNAVVTDQERFDAIKSSAAKAIDSFIAKLSAEGTRN